MIKVKKSLNQSLTCLSFLATLSALPSIAFADPAVTTPAAADPAVTAPISTDPYQAIRLDSQEANSSTIVPSNVETITQNVTSVSQLSDVRPTDWAFPALQSLVERYGCIAGYPDRTFRGNQATSRYEFAAGLNACLD